MDLRNRSFAVPFRLFSVVVVFAFASVLPAERVQDLPKPTDYVSDFAHVLSPAAIARIDGIARQLDRPPANAQIAVVTVHSLEGEDAADWANQLEDKWKIGKKGSDKGVLILLAINDHRRRIEVGYGLEGILPDGKLGDIGRSVVPFLRQSDYDDAAISEVRQVAQVIAADANVSLDDAPAPAPSRHVARRGFPLGGIIFFLIILLLFGGFRFLAFLFGWNLLTGGYRRGPFIGGGWGGGGGFGGGDGGGGGGGFGGFGRGSFGGGGAGGDW